MLLEKIKLENFRQFRNESVEFASGKDGKNVTIIMGDNGSGKTTFAQAFFWCLYGETEFSDKIILNRLVANELMPGTIARVAVTLELKHGDVSYKLIREQNYKKDYAGKVKPENSVFNISKKGASGVTEFVKQSQCESEVKSILPKELSRYFFFDGERIEKMSKDITGGKKAQDFAEAVKGLLGLNAMYSAIQHFNPARSTSTSVIRSYEASYDAHSNAKIAEYSSEIERLTKEIANIETQIESYDAEIASASARKDQKTEEIKQYTEGAKLQEDKEKIIRRIEIIRIQKAATIQSISQVFNSGAKSFFSVFLTQKALRIMADKDLVGKDIPHMHQDTIEYLLGQRMCICGTHLDPGTVPYERVKALMEFLPPKTMSTTISEFKRDAIRRAGDPDILEQIASSMAIISQQNDELASLADDLHIIEGKLSGDDVREKVRTIHREIQLCEDIIRKNRGHRDSALQRKGAKERDRERSVNERRNLTLLDDKNRKIELYKAYAECIYAELQTAYNTHETEIRERLQATINDIFKQIYAGGLSLTIDDKYRISVYATDYDGDVETSTAQSISVIFAFITGIIKMARDNRNASNQDAQLLSSEPYPLVMDAPLSAFDKRRIKTVCEALPETAEQVVIFIKDTDGELAEVHMGSRIGSRHSFDKVNEFETHLV